jgi:hypothetical protein
VCGNMTQQICCCCCCCVQAFDSPTYPHLAVLGVDVDWNERFMLRVEGGYRPR